MTQKRRINKWTWILAMVIASPVISQAQSMRFGIEAGPGMSILYGNDFIKQKNHSHPGACSGITFQYEFSNHLSLKTGINYELKSSETGQVEFTNQNGELLGTGKAVLNFNYISLPVLFRYEFGKARNYFVNAGPYAAYLMKSETKTVINTLTHTTEKFSVVVNGYEKFEYGLIFGVGYQRKINEHFIVSGEIRNNLGLSSILSPIQNPVNSRGIINWPLKTESIFFVFGCQYLLGK
ncbi:MAG: outer membrane beta-barrel protein [Bacteroidetes bacterium]|nr:outer membrane beta-barrel protein [Bacteroidota bacterium]